MIGIPCASPIDVGWITGSIGDAARTGDPNATALSIDGVTPWTYAELSDRCDQLARGLVRSGIRHGDRVGLLLPNTPDYVALYFAAARLGAIAVRLNWRLAPDELKYIVDDSRCSVVCFDPSFGERLERIRQGTPRPRLLTIDAASPSADGLLLSGRGGLRELALPSVKVAPNDTVMLMYTSGTTGHPKGVTWTHSNTLWHATIQAMKFGFSPDTVALTTGPLYHAGAFEVLLLPALLSRGTAVSLSSGNFSIDKLISVIQRAGVTDALLYPFMLYDLLRHRLGNKQHLPSLRRIKCGGDTIMPWAVEALETELPGVELVVTYGLTEGGANSTYLDFADIAQHAETVGRPLPLTRVEVVRPDRSACEVGEVGEIAVSGPTVSPGYWNDPQATAETFAGGWCRTGDLGFLDDDGYLTVTGRLKDMIRSGGENIYPAEVEAVLTRHPLIRDAAVIGVPDTKFAEVGCAVIVLEDESDVRDADLDGYCRAHLAGYKRPRHWVRVEALPRNAAGKVLKYQLREIYAGIAAPAIAADHTGRGEPR